MNKESTLDYYTTGRVELYGKTKIFICMHRKETKLLERRVKPELEKYCNDAALFFLSDNPEYNPIQPSEYLIKLSAELAEMNGIFICVTKALIEDTSDLTWFIIKEAQKMGTSLLPYFCEPNLYDAWNNLVPLQSIDPFNPDPTMVPYTVKIENWIKRIAPLSDDIIQKIWASFDSKIFISYRKKDRCYIDPLMRTVHSDSIDAPLSRVGLWYDEELTSEKDFNTIIKDQALNSQLVLMLITPNMLALNESGEPNYVITTEYPMIAAAKPIIGIVAEETDEAQLTKIFPAIKTYISLNDRSQIQETVSAYLKIFEQEVASPLSEEEKQYYQGLAYLHGIGVEKDSHKAIELFESLTQKVFEFSFYHPIQLESIRKIVAIHFDETEKNKGVKGLYNPELGLNSQLSLIEALKRQSDHSEAAVKEIVDESLRLVRLLKTSDRASDLENASLHAYQLLLWLNEYLVNDTYITNHALICAMIGASLIEMGLVWHKRNNFRDSNKFGREPGAIFYLRDGIESFEKYIEADTFSMDDLYLLSSAYDHMADACYRQGHFTEQRDYLARKIKLVRKKASNAMDHAQVYELDHSLFLYAEACIMCGPNHLSEAINVYNDLKKDLIEKRNLLYDDNFTLLYIQLQNGLGKAFMCEADKYRFDLTNADHQKLKDMCESTAFGSFDEAVSVCSMYMKEMPQSPLLPQVEYWLGVSFLNLYCSMKSQPEGANPDLFRNAFFYINAAAKNMSRPLSNDVNHYIYRCYAERAAIEQAQLFSGPNNFNANLFDSLEAALVNCYDDIQNDISKHNDYWISLDRVELLCARARLLLLLAENYQVNPDCLKEISVILERAYGAARAIYEKEGCELTYLLLSTLKIVCDLKSKFALLLGDQNDFHSWLNEISVYNKELGINKYCDYTK